MIKLHISLAAIMIVTLSSCAPVGSIARHDFGSGYYNLKSEKGSSVKVYADVYEDSLVIYKMKPGSSETPDTESGQGTRISTINPESYLFKSSFNKNSIEFDLSTMLTKLRPASSGVPLQMSANLNALVYMGARKDYYVIKSHRSPLNRDNSSVRQLGYDFGIFAGIGITPVNPTVTNDNTSLEYDGIVFQKGIGTFITLNYVSFGITLGFDNLMSGDSKIWIYNNKPYIGFAIGIANF
jgi:hypothetical protein